MSAYSEAMRRLLAGEELPADTARGLMHGMMAGELGDIRVSAALTALQAKGVTVPELVALARGMRDHMVRVPTHAEALLDTCGTGGSGLDTPNTSTMAAFVVAAAGVKVAKHGNRASSGKCGSSDLLDGLGVPLAVGPEAAARLIEKVGLAFLFAPAYHPAVRHVVPVRKGLGFRTAFNLLGPLCNPAGADHQLLGVGDPSGAAPMAAALAALGSKRVLVVHGDDGLDELSPCAPSRTWLVEGGAVTEGRFAPEDVGFTRLAPDDIRGGDVATNVAIARSVLSGEPGPYRQLVALNAGAALWVAGAADGIADGIRRADAILESGDAMALLDAYRSAVKAEVAAEASDAR